MNEYPATPTQTDDSVARFAEDLRELRREHGNPTLVSIEHATGISKSVVSAALKGDTLPTENTVERLALLFDADTRAWQARRARLDSRGRSTVPPLRQESSQDPKRRFGMRALVGTGIAAAVLSAGITSAVWVLLTPGPVPGMQAVADGNDPMSTVCRDDAIIAASETRALDTQVQMMYSKSCKAVWGRVTRYDGEAIGNEISMKIYPAIDLHSSRNQEVSSFDVPSVYTTLMISPHTEERICGIATMTADGKPVDLGHPVCI